MNDEWMEQKVTFLFQKSETQTLYAFSLLIIASAFVIYFT